MEDAVRNFGKKLRKGGVGLFYYAGHGIQVNGKNYLIPIDAKIESESDVKYESVDAGRILGKMEDAENDVNIVILDACRNNPFSRGFRSNEQGLAQIDAPKGSLIAYATAPGSIAADGNKSNGTYTAQLIHYMKIPGLTIEQILKKVRIAVANETSNNQIPWESSSLMGDFYFYSEKSNTLDNLSASPRVSSQSSRVQDGLIQIPPTDPHIEVPHQTEIFNISFFARNDQGSKKYSEYLEQTLRRLLLLNKKINLSPSSTQNKFTIKGIYEFTDTNISMELRLIYANKIVIGKAYRGHINQTETMLSRFTDAVTKEVVELQNK